MKTNFLDALKVADSYTFTENGAFCYSSTGNRNLDAFGSLGAMMRSDAGDILDIFVRAFNEDRKTAMRMLFYMRDIRGGQGQRRVFRIILRYLANTDPEFVNNNLDNVLFFGRGDDYLCLFGTQCEKAMVTYVKSVLDEDIAAVKSGGNCSLLAKWLPSENSSSASTIQYARKMRNALTMSPREYRKMLSMLRANIQIVESKMSSNKWEDIDFSKLPSKAAMIYSDAFMKHAEHEYISYLADVANGDSKINASTLFPVDIISKVMETLYSNKISKKDKILYDCMWKALPNYFGDSEETGICVVDTSGSMSGVPINVALSLGMYCADKCKGPFKGHFITFSATPKLQSITGVDIYEKVRGMNMASWGMNTDMEAVFDLILNTAVSNNLTQEDLPSKLYIISDMQFDAATTGRYEYTNKMTFMKSMEKKYADAGYTVPAIVYWNVRESNCGMFHKKFNDTDCCMVSGYSASLFKSVIDGTEYEEITTEDGKKVNKQKIDPMNVMLTTLYNERYDRVYTGG